MGRDGMVEGALLFTVLYCDFGGRIGEVEAGLRKTVLCAQDHTFLPHVRVWAAHVCMLFIYLWFNGAISR